jgi:hypothetical protein
MCTEEALLSSERTSPNRPSLENRSFADPLSTPSMPSNTTTPGAPRPPALPASPAAPPLPPAPPPPAAAAAVPPAAVRSWAPATTPWGAAAVPPAAGVLLPVLTVLALAPALPTVLPAPPAAVLLLLLEPSAAVPLPVKRLAYGRRTGLTRALLGLTDSCRPAAASAVLTVAAMSSLPMRAYAAAGQPVAAGSKQEND